MMSRHECVEVQVEAPCAENASRIIIYEDGSKDYSTSRKSWTLQQ